MKQNLIFAIYDLKSDCFSNFIVSDDVRNVRLSVYVALKDKEDTLLYQYASDYSMYQLAEIDEKTGNVVPCKKEVFTFNEVKSQLLYKESEDAKV